MPCNIPDIHTPGVKCRAIRQILCLSHLASKYHAPNIVQHHAPYVIHQASHASHPEPHTQQALQRAANRVGAAIGASEKRQSISPRIVLSLTGNIFCGIGGRGAGSVSG